MTGPSCDQPECITCPRKKNPDQQQEEQECPHCQVMVVHECQDDMVLEDNRQVRLDRQNQGLVPPQKDPPQVPVAPGSHETEVMHDKEGEGEEQTLEKIHFDADDVEAALDMLSLQAAPGPDGVPAICLKKAKKPIS